MYRQMRKLIQQNRLPTPSPCPNVQNKNRTTFPRRAPIAPPHRPSGYRSNLRTKATNQTCTYVINSLCRYLTPTLCFFCLAFQSRCHSVCSLLYIMLIHFLTNIIHYILSCQGRSVRPIQHTHWSIITLALTRHVHVNPSSHTFEHDGRWQDAISGVRKQFFQRRQRNDE